jgi:hypothetical protein
MMLTSKGFKRYLMTGTLESILGRLASHNYQVNNWVVHRNPWSNQVETLCIRCNCYRVENTTWSCNLPPLRLQQSPGKSLQSPRLLEAVVALLDRCDGSISHSERISGSALLDFPHVYFVIMPRSCELISSCSFIGCKWPPAGFCMPVDDGLN